MSLTLRINDKAVQVELRGMEDRIEPRALLKIAGEVMRTSVEETFEAEGFPAGSWRRVGRGGEARAGKKILTESGLLRESINFDDIQGRQLRIGTNVEYARIHQEGGVIRPKTAKALKIPLPTGGVIFRKEVTIPARPFLLFKPSDPDDIAEAMEGWITAGEEDRR